MRCIFCANKKNVDRSVRLDPKSGWKQKPIDENLVYDLFLYVKTHLESVWWNPESSINEGKLINISGNE